MDGWDGRMGAAGRSGASTCGAHVSSSMTVQWALEERVAGVIEGVFSCEKF